MIVPYSLEFDTSISGSIYYRETFQPDILQRTEIDVQLLHQNFTPTQAVIVTYHEVPLRSDPLLKHTFQVIIASNGTLTYAVFNFIKLDRSHGLFGFAEKICYIKEQEANPYTHNLSEDTNVDSKGKFVYLLTRENCKENKNGNFFCFLFFIFSFVR